MAKMKTKPKAAKKKVAKKGAPKARSMKRAKPKAAAKAKPKSKPARGGAKRRSGRKGAGDGVLSHLEFDNGADEPAAVVVTLNGVSTPDMPTAQPGRSATVDGVSWTSGADSSSSQVSASVRGVNPGTTLRANKTFNIMQPALAMIDRLVVSLSSGALSLAAFDASGAPLPIRFTPQFPT